MFHGQQGSKLIGVERPSFVPSGTSSRRRGVTTLRVAAPPFRVSVHQPDAKMPERRLGNLLRMSAARALNFDRVR
jgi:hypothetical protein